MYRHRLALLGASVLTAVALVAGLLAAPALADEPPGTPTATTVAPTPTVGTFFTDGFPGRHTCTGSVIASPTRDLVITAAHCVSGTAAGWLFVPGYDGTSTTDQAPYGVWTVEHAYVAPQWESRQDTQYDYAILQLADQSRGGRRVGIQDVTGANVLATAPRPGTTITDIAYNGRADLPVSCTIATYDEQGYPAFNCDDYVGGSSGSPWLSTIRGTHLLAVRGVIGGLHQGGCYSYTSYSSSFTPEIYAVYARAVLGRHPDTVPAAGSDGC